MIRIVTIVELCEAFLQTGNCLGELAAHINELLKVTGVIFGRDSHVMNGVLVVGVDVFVDILVDLEVFVEV